MVRAYAQISVGFDSPEFRYVEHGARQARHCRSVATRIVDTVVQLRFPLVSKPWKGPLPKPRKPPELRFGGVLIRDKRAKGISEEKLKLDTFIEGTSSPNWCGGDTVLLAGTASSMPAKVKMVSKFRL